MERFVSPKTEWGIGLLYFKNYEGCYFDCFLDPFFVPGVLPVIIGICIIVVLASHISEKYGCGVGCLVLSFGTILVLIICFSLFRNQL